MDKNICITPLGHDVLLKKKKELEFSLKKKSNDLVSSGYRNQLTEITDILNNSTITEFNENIPASVQIGTHVLLENLKNGDKREYIIMTHHTANPLKGVISNESPMAQKMMGFKLGNTFKFKDISGVEDSFKISNIE